jgi:hypothetical protein
MNKKKNISKLIILLLLAFGVTFVFNKSSVGDVKIVGEVVKLMKSSPIDQEIVKRIIVLLKKMNVVKKKENISFDLGEKDVQILKKYVFILLDNYRYKIPGLKNILEKVIKMRIVEFSNRKSTIYFLFSNEKFAKEGKRIFNGYFQIFKGMMKGGLKEIEKKIAEKGDNLYSKIPSENDFKISKLTYELMEFIKITQDKKRVLIKLDNGKKYIELLDLQKESLKISVKNLNENKKKLCFSNMKTIEGALVLLGMEKAKITSIPTIEQLVKAEYLRKVPRCPQGGNYTIFKTGDKFLPYSIKCSIHGLVGGEK